MQTPRVTLIAYGAHRASVMARNGIASQFKQPEPREISECTTPLAQRMREQQERAKAQLAAAKAARIAWEKQQRENAPAPVIPRTRVW